MSKLVAAPLAVVRPVRQKVHHAVETGRLGNLSADRGLDVLTFFLADVQTGFGPFIAVYLSANHWSAAQIGTALGIGAIVTMACQVPAGAAIDATPWKRGATFVALLAVMGSAVLLALFPSRVPVIGAEILHGIASCTLVPAVAAVSLSRVGRAAIAGRFARNTRFMALGNGIGAVLMGLAGAYVATSAPFWLAAVFTLPAIFALLALPPRHESEPPPPRLGARKATAEGWHVLLDRRLLAFVFCVVLFHTANSFILPLAMTRLEVRTGSGNSNMTLAACLLVSQAMVALISPWFGTHAESWGRRPVLLLGFAMVPLHAGTLVLLGGTYAVVAAQLLDGMGGAMFGVLQPLVAADITRGTNRFNLSLGVLGLAAGLGGTLSSMAGGRIASAFGYPAGFSALAAAGLAAVAAVWLLMPETRPDSSGSSGRPMPAPARGARRPAPEPRHAAPAPFRASVRVGNWIVAASVGAAASGRSTTARIAPGMAATPTGRARPAPVPDILRLDGKAQGAVWAAWPPCCRACKCISA